MIRIDPPRDAEVCARFEEKFKEAIEKWEYDPKWLREFWYDHEISFHHTTLFYNFRLEANKVRLLTLSISYMDFGKEIYRAGFWLNDDFLEQKFGTIDECLTWIFERLDQWNSEKKFIGEHDGNSNSN